MRQSTGAGAPQHGERLSFDVRYDGSFAAGWRAVVADRLDVNRLGNVAGNTNVNTLKEAYLSWQATPERVADLGRINARHGVAMGYNPTDYFRAGALRWIVSPDPASLRENRLGSVMLRGQKLWDGGSVSALYSPKLADQPSTGAYSVDLGATNRRDRWLAAFSQRLSEQISPQFLVSGGTGQSAQLGFNLALLLNKATVAFAEWSGGRTRSLLAQALARPEDAAFRSRLAAGFTYTTESNVSLTLEYEYNGTGLDRDGWNELRRGPPAAYGVYRSFAAKLQEPVTRENLFFHATWTDAMVRHLDLTAMVRYNVADHSRLQWLEARYHWTRVDLALQAQRNDGDPSSDFGALPERRTLQAVLRYFF
ncbi:MAG: hypothetical protein EPO29_01145 [Betaproteobacteria bacterium]|nr:MAG: hypothetical protein EPO29_01145 [Betaproteobacteria bacterium]